MFTAAEKNALLLTVTFLLLGAGIKLWIKSKVEIGPFADAPSAALAAAPADQGDEGTPEDSARSDRLPADSALAGPTPEDTAKIAPVPAEPKAAAREAKPRGKDKPSAKAAKVDLNLASVESLAAVPGIGPKTAEAILEYRKAKGGIRDVRELLEVKGIGEKKLEKIRPWVLSSAGGMEAESEVAP